MDNLDEEMPTLYPLEHSTTPPWIQVVPTTRLDCAKYIKDTTDPTIYRHILGTIIDHYCPKWVIYTDGSKTEVAVGAAFVIPNESYKFSLDPKCSVYTAELFAILKAMEFRTSAESDTYIICSDSRSAITVIRNIFSPDPIIKKILDLHSFLNNQSKSVVFVWCPGHIGICGNENADTAARATAAQQSSETENYPLKMEDFKAYLKSKINHLWQINWERSDTQLRLLQPTVAKFSYSNTLTRREQVCLTRMRIGHTRLTSSYMLLNQEPPRCNTCQVRLTLIHIILECQRLPHARTICKIPQTVSGCFRNKEMCNKLLQFVKFTGFIGSL
nr:unnamed protein product [Callosobruchus analis]CAI5836888.1 unnamed protein product [Callosobruchus analis]